MHKLDDFRVFFSFGVASFLVPLAYIMRAFLEIPIPEGASAVNREIFFSIGITILFVFGLSISRWIATQLIKSRAIRKFILGSAYTEGYWYLKTEIVTGGDYPLQRSGIAYMSYKLDSREFKIETIRYVGERKYVTQSEVGYVRTTGSTLRYLNFFKMTYPDPDGASGFASGRFSYGDHFAKTPQFFDAVIAVQDGAFIGGQYAERISDAIVEKYHKEHGSKWQKVFIEEQDSHQITAEALSEEKAKKVSAKDLKG